MYITLNFEMNLILKVKSIKKYWKIINKVTWHSLRVSCELLFSSSFLMKVFIVAGFYALIIRTPDVDEDEETDKNLKEKRAVPSQALHGYI